MLSLILKGERLISRRRAILKTIFCISYSFGVMSKSILEDISIWDPILKIGPFTTLVKVKVHGTYIWGHIHFTKTISPCQAKGLGQKDGTLGFKDTLVTQYLKKKTNNINVWNRLRSKFVPIQAIRALRDLSFSEYLYIIIALYW